MHKLEGNLWEHEGEQYFSEKEPEIDSCKGCSFDPLDHSYCPRTSQGNLVCMEHEILFKKRSEYPFREVQKEEHKAAPFEANTKESNPKDVIGVTKAPMSIIPMQVIHEVGLGLLEGSLKYGSYNYRVAGVRFSVYYDATQRHLNSFLEGEDIDPASGINHITKAIASLVVLRDGMLNDKFIDDRPPKPLNENWMEDINKKTKELLAKYPQPVAPYTQKGI